MSVPVEPASTTLRPSLSRNSANLLSYDVEWVRPFPPLVMLAAAAGQPSRDLFLIPRHVDLSEPHHYDNVTCAAPLEVRAAIAHAQYRLLLAFVTLSTTHRKQWALMENDGQTERNGEYAAAVIEREKLALQRLPKVELHDDIEEVDLHERMALLRLGPKDHGKGAWAVAVKRFIREAKALGRQLWPQVLDGAGVLVDQKVFIKWEKELDTGIAPLY
ncbi:hypothetical protein F5Y18DRAFT_435417 [Xylariaceae sp. FL1019]|nr:hypothetical protein F5Y18DRAFT_435417 [Xylariaceae sp. FL1019]